MVPKTMPCMHACMYANYSPNFLGSKVSGIDLAIERLNLRIGFYTVLMIRIENCLDTGLSI